MGIPLKARTAHRWLAIFSGLLLGAWLISGLVMILPAPTPDAVRPWTPSLPSYSAATLAPDRVATLVAQLASPGAHVTTLRLRTVDGVLVYDARTDDGGVHLVDAASGAVMVITEVRARRLATAALQAGMTPSSVRRHEAHTRSYPRGPLPAFEVRFADGPGTRVYVDGATGDVQVTDRVSRMRAAIISLHNFSFLQVLLLGSGGTRALMVVVALASLAVVASGYLLAVKTRRRFRHVG